MQQATQAPLALRERERQQKIGRRFTIGVIGVVVAAIVAGGVYAAVDSNSAMPAFPSAPPHAKRLWASQTTQQLGATQIVSVALYRSTMTPTQTIAYFRRAIPHTGGDIGKFTITVKRGDQGALPTALPQLPTDFVNGKGATATANYTFTEYHQGNNDIGVAVDLRKPNGPTLIFVDMLTD